MYQLIPFTNRKSIRGRQRWFLLFPFVVISFTLLPAAYAAVVVSPNDDFSASHDVEVSMDDARGQAVVALQNKIGDSLMRKPEVVGHGIGLDRNGVPALTIWVDRNAPRASEVVRALPEQVDGVNVQVELSDRFRAALASGPVANGTGAHTEKQRPPIELGTSGGWEKAVYDSKLGCCGGTLGALVRLNGSPTLYVLSNYHVFDGDRVPGHNNTIAKSGDFIIQPSLADGPVRNCSDEGAHRVAALLVTHSLPNNNVDCAVAGVLRDGEGNPMVRPDGSILEIGPLSSHTKVVRGMGRRVKKSGRNGLTRGQVTNINVTAKVEYRDECVGDFAFIETFTGQILVLSRSGFFSDEGDSGSVVVEDRSEFPRAIGLIISTDFGTAKTLANPIRDVLTFLDATMVGVDTLETD